MIFKVQSDWITKICYDENILKVCNTYNSKESNLKTDLKIFGKMCLSNDIPESFESHLKFFLSKDLMGIFENIFKMFKIYILLIPMCIIAMFKSNQ